MTKTLTEQWKDGELIFGKTYWCSDDEGNIAKLVLVGEDRFYEWTLGTEVTKDVKEVLAPVPSYDAYRQLVSKTEQLEKKLEIATKALEYYAQCKHLNLDILAMLLEKHKNEFADFEVYEDGETARNALKEMKGVK